MNWKETYTKIFLKQAGKSVNDISVKEHFSIWWQNTRDKNTGGLRLTDEGYRFITEEIDIKTYAVPFPKDLELTTNVILWLDNFIDCPYYLCKNEIIVTNEVKAVELSMFSGNIRKFGITKAFSRQKALDT